MEITGNQNDYELRKATSLDAPAIKKLVKKILAGFDPSYDGSDPENDLYQLDETYFKNGGSFLVITHTGVIVSCLGLLPLDERCAKLKKMYVDPDHRKKGLAALFLTEIIHQAKESGFVKIKLETMSSMYSAISLYQQFGFERIDAVPFSKRCDIVMEKII